MAAALGAACALAEVFGPPTQVRPLTPRRSRRYDDARQRRPNGEIARSVRELPSVVERMRPDFGARDARQPRN